MAQGSSGGPMYHLNQPNQPIYFVLNANWGSPQMTLLAGAQIGARNGGDPGLGSLNLAGDIYRNGVSMTATAVAWEKVLQASKPSSYSVQASDSNTWVAQHRRHRRGHFHVAELPRGAA